jgi:hypothetical protein
MVMPPPSFVKNSSIASSSVGVAYLNTGLDVYSTITSNTVVPYSVNLLKTGFIDKYLFTKYKSVGVMQENFDFHMKQ